MMVSATVGERVPFIDRRGRVCGYILVAAEHREGPNPLIRIDMAEAIAEGEHEVQLLEGTRYEYRVEAQAGWDADTSNRLVRSSLLDGAAAQRGVIATGNETGSFEIGLVDERGDAVATAAFEIRSSKLGYRDEYRSMLDEVSDRALDLILHLNAPTTVNLASLLSGDPESLRQQFTVLRSVFESGELTDALGKILANPHSALIETVEDVRIGESRRADRSLIRQLVSRHPRRPVPLGHPLNESLKRALGVTVPQDVLRKRHVETKDTPENRFVKHVLQVYTEYLAALASVLHRLSTSGYSPYVDKSITPLVEILESYLHLPFFGEVSDSANVASGSPVLQRRSGYRQVLSSWLAFNSLLALDWEGAADLFSEGRKNVALLYEYWLLFVLVDVMEKLSGGVGDDQSNSIIALDRDGYRLKLRTGSLLEFERNAEMSGRRIAIQLSYNRTFKRVNAHQAESDSGLSYSRASEDRGSWTRVMRPDFTVSIRPAGLSVQDAEAAEEIVHVHFDAKYRVNRFTDLFGAEDPDLNLVKKAEESGTYQRADLLKMHAYRDAIRQSEGAYVLYPGLDGVYDAEAHHLFAEGFHELLPGLGAFVVRPGSGSHEAVRTLTRFLEDVLRASMRNLR